MRWKLLRRRLTVSAPRMIVRSHMAWPLKWALAALALGFAAAAALWAFEFGRELAGVDRRTKVELLELREEVVRLRADHERAVSVANTSDSLLATERAAQERLAQTVRQLEAENQALKADLGFFERLLPAAGDSVAVRGLKADVLDASRVGFQALVMQSGKGAPEFTGRYEVTLSGTLNGKPWTQADTSAPAELKVKQYARVEGSVNHPPEAVVKSLQFRLLDARGAQRALERVQW